MSSTASDGDRRRREIPGDQAVYCLGPRGSSRRDVHLDRTCKFLAGADDEDIECDTRDTWPDAKPCPNCTGLIETAVTHDPMANQNKLEALNAEDYP